MRKLRTLLLFLTLLIFLTACERTDYDMTNKPLENSMPAPSLTHILNPDSEVRGVWIASVYNIDYPSRPDLSADELKREIGSVLAKED